jgi:hypothetical protein
LKNLATHVLAPDANLSNFEILQKYLPNSDLASNIPKFFHFSGHQENTIQLLRALNLKKLKWIEPGTGIFLEFESSESGAVAKLVKVNIKDETIIEEGLPLFGGESSIKLSDFIAAVEKKLSLANIENFKNHCSLHDEPQIGEPANFDSS